MARPAKIAKSGRNRNLRFAFAIAAGLRARACLHSQVSDVPNLFSRYGAQGRNSRCHESELVSQPVTSGENMQTDPIADFLTCIRNAAAAKHQRVDVPSSKLKTEIARIFKDEGYISTYKMVDENKTRKLLRVFLKYTPDRRSVITGVKRISRPGARRYLGAADIRPVVGGLGISIMTTPKGLMSGRAARKAKMGGEILCEVW